jgi:hypothetical protein
VLSGLSELLSFKLLRLLCRDDPNGGATIATGLGPRLRGPSGESRDESPNDLYTDNTDNTDNPDRSLGIRISVHRP